jgi:hypothetical protein
MKMKTSSKYVTDSKLKVVMERVDRDTDTRVHLENFEVVTEREGSTCGNVRVVFDKKGNAKLSDIDSYREDEAKGYIDSYRQISSALALYRTISYFQCGLSADDCDFYKLNWLVKLRHKKTGKLLHLGEWKGGFQIFTEAGSLKDLPKQFIKDTESFLTHLASKDFTIGYDGTVAGSVA